jgi:ATP-dependent DNA helicase RecQ
LPLHDSLFEKLRAWRAQQAKTNNVPAYVIMHDATLRAIAQARPVNTNDLFAISGLGEKRIERYGDQILSLVTS